MVTVIVAPTWYAVTIPLGVAASVPSSSSPQGPSFSGKPMLSCDIQHAGACRTKCASALRADSVSAASKPSGATRPREPRTMAFILRQGSALAADLALAVDRIVRRQEFAHLRAALFGHHPTPRDETFA